MHKNRKGIILAGGSGTRLHPLTASVSKQLMPVYDKPMIYYPLSALMKCGIREILIISTPRDLPNFEALFGDGTQLGLQISYKEQPKPEGLAQALLLGEEFLDGAPVCLVLGDNLFYGANFDKRIQSAHFRDAGATIFGCRVTNPSDYGVVEFSPNGKAISLEEKPIRPKSSWAVPGIYFYDGRVVEYAKSIKPSKRGELEITDLNQIYLEANDLHVEMLGRGIAWLDTGNPDSLIAASHFVQTIQHRQNLKIACIEEIAYTKRWINHDQMMFLVNKQKGTEYGQYLDTILNTESLEAAVI